MNTQAACPTTSAFAVESQSPYLQIRHLFPVFSEDRETIFFDNASTTQKPKCVLDEFDNFYRLNCSNAGRAVYPASFRAAQRIDQARRDVARFINASANEIAFTSGATDSLNTVAWSWGLENLNDGDEVLYCPDDHSSAILPWQNLQSVLGRMGRNIKLVPFAIHPVGDYDFQSIRNGLTEKTRIILMSHIHHVFGADMEVTDIRKIVGPNVILSLDASQSIGHTPVDVRALDADFVSFSGHKMFAGNGVGVLFAKEQLHRQLTPIRCGGKIQPTHEPAGQTRSSFIDKVECGTPNIPAISSMSAAISFIEEIGLQNISNHVSQLTTELINNLSTLPGIVFSPGPVTCGCPGGFGILSFRFEQAESMDIASALAYEQIHVRSGAHCRASGEAKEDFIRISMHAYNTVEEIGILTESLRSILA